jgi:hypothetical protein
VSVSYRLAVFDALMLRALILEEGFRDEAAAFRAAFQGRRFRVLLTEGILSQYQVESAREPRFPAQPTLARLASQGRAVFLQENRLNRAYVQLTGLPQEHQEFILDALAGGASYLVTSRPAWLNLSEQTSNHALQTITPRLFAQL